MLSSHPARNSVYSFRSYSGAFTSSCIDAGKMLRCQERVQVMKMPLSSFAKSFSTSVSFHSDFIRPESVCWNLLIVEHKSDICVAVEVRHSTPERGLMDGQASRRQRPGQPFLNFSGGCTLFVTTCPDSELTIPLAEVYHDPNLLLTCPFFLFDISNLVLRPLSLRWSLHNRTGSAGL